MAPNRNKDMKSILRSADCVCFDVDSTLIIDEGIDELASYIGVGKKVAQLTHNAMGGKMTFLESLTQRLNIMKPTQQQVAKFICNNPPQLSDGVVELVDLLQERDVDIYIVSGGLGSLVAPVAEALGIPASNVYANRLKFYFDGQYAGFDETQPTCQSGGKPKVIQSLKKKHNYKCVVHVGDGSTDLEAYPPADGFIGFGGNQVREAVQQEAPWFVTSFQDMSNELQCKNPKLTTPLES